MDLNRAPSNAIADAIARVSQVYEPIVLLRAASEVLILARVGMKNTQRFMILNEAGEPAWKHEPLGSLSDAGWALRAHQWHLTDLEPIGANQRTAKTLARLLKERA